MLHDLRYAVRTLFRSPAFTFTSVATLALGIGANTVMFSVVNAVLLRPLPYPQPDRLAVVSSLNRDTNIGQIRATPLDFYDWRSQTATFDGMAGHVGTGFTFSGDREPELVIGQLVTADFFRVLGVRPLIGVTFTPDAFSGRENQLVIGYGLWQRRFGGDRAVAGRAVTVNGKPYTIVGVMPPGFAYPAGRYQLWTPLPQTPSPDMPPINRAAHYLQVIARLKAGATVTGAQAEMSTIARRLAAQYPSTDRDLDAVVAPLSEQSVKGVRTGLLILLGAVGCVVLIACANVTNLLLARATARQREVAIRGALGAGRWRLVRQFLTETIVLYTLGAAGALAIAAWGLAALVAFNPGDIPRLAEASLDGRVLLFTLLVSLATALLFGLAPAVHTSSADVARALKSAGRTSSAGDRHQRLRGAIVIAELALSVVLLVGASLALRSFVRLMQVDPGFEVDDQLTFTMVMTKSMYPDVAQMAAFTRAVDERLASLPEVEHEGATTHLPFSGQNLENGFQIEGLAVAPDEQPPVGGMRGVTPGYFAALGVPLKAGRFFTDADREGAPPVAIVNEAFARRYWGSQNPIGRRLREFGYDDWRTVVGIVGNIKHSGPEGDARPEVDLPYPQLEPGFMTSWSRGLTYVVRARVGSAAIAPLARARIGELDASMPLNDVQPMSALASEVVAQPRFRTVLLGAFAALAMALATVGVFGLLSYYVTQRTQEIGIRVALGAQPRDLVRMIVSHGVKLAAAGIAIGIAAAIPVSRVMRSMLFGVAPTDVPTFAAAIAALAVVAAAASYIPARRATRVDPIAALRAE
jgi:putative ABC transport system permease protein